MLETQENLDFRGEVTNYGVHSIYSFPGRFPPQLPAYFIEKYNPEIVCDCFGGSGTTAVEAKMHGCHAIHMDIMPISLMLARVKTHEYTQMEFHHGLTTLNRMLDSSDYTKTEIPRFLLQRLTKNGMDDYYFPLDVVKQIITTRECIDLIQEKHVREFAKLCGAQCLRRCSNIDQKGNEWKRAGPIHCNPNYISQFRTVIDQAHVKFIDFQDKNPKFLNEKVPSIIDTRTEWLTRSFDLLMTSPPYGTNNVVNYPNIHQFAHLFFCDDEPPEPIWFIQTTPQLNLYFNRVLPFLKQDGHAVIVVAPSFTDDWKVMTINILENQGLELTGSTCRSIDPGRKSSARPITSEWVLEFKKK